MQITTEQHNMPWILKFHLKPSGDMACRLHFPSANSFARSLVRLNASVLCHGKRVRVTGSFRRRSCAQIMESFGTSETKEP
jgi:hypothetical protein